MDLFDEALASNMAAMCSLQRGLGGMHVPGLLVRVRDGGMVHLQFTHFKLGKARQF